MDCMEKEFEDYWNKHQKRLILNAPKALRDEYIESTKLDSPIDWVCLSCLWLWALASSQFWIFRVRFSLGQ